MLRLLYLTVSFFFLGSFVDGDFDIKTKVNTEGVLDFSALKENLGEGVAETGRRTDSGWGAGGAEATVGSIDAGLKGESDFSHK